MKRPGSSQISPKHKNERPTLTFKKQEITARQRKLNESHIYTDGGAKVEGKPPVSIAGYGVAHYKGRENKKNTTPTESESGPVITKEGDHEYHGAKQRTNNTGELTAMLIAILWALAKPRGSYTVIHSDSTYALTVPNTTRKPKANKDLVYATRRALKKARAKHGYRNIRFIHVYSHTNDARNDEADRLATLGMKIARKIYKRGTIIPPWPGRPDTND